MSEGLHVWVVYGDDHDYDFMSQWLVGVYLTEESAKAASEADGKIYDDAHQTKNGATYTITKTIVRA